MAGAAVFAREVTGAPQGWGVVVGGLILLFCGALMTAQAKYLSADEVNGGYREKWNGLVQYMRVGGLYVLVPLGLIVAVIGIVQLLL